MGTRERSAAHILVDRDNQEVMARNGRGKSLLLRCIVYRMTNLSSDFDYERSTEHSTYTVVSLLADHQTVADQMVHKWPVAWPGLHR